MGENFYEAAIRHLTDGRILQKEECYDNAVYLYGYAAECALKSMITVYCGNADGFLRRAYSHSGADILNDLYLFVVNESAAPMLDPALGMKLQKYVLPEVLFWAHPERRYLANGQFDEGDADACRGAAEFLVNEMVSQHIDGYL